MEISTILVTPDLAREWLDKHNTNNRPLQKGHVGFLANQMKAGKWMETGDSIKFGKNRELIDGQHRLMAIIRTGIPIPFLVVREVDDEAFEVIDTGRKRSAADVLMVASIFEGGPERMKFLSGAIRAILGRGHLTGYNSEILQFARDNEYLCSQALTLLNELPGNGRKIVRPSALMAAFILICQKGVAAVDAKNYLVYFVSGVGLGVLQTRLRDKLVSLLSAHSEYYMKPAIWILLTGWNANAGNKNSGNFKQPATWDRPDVVVPQRLQFQQATP